MTNILHSTSGFAIIFISKENCAPCSQFLRTWHYFKNRLTKEVLSQSIKAIRIHEIPGKINLAPFIKRYAQWTPSIILVEMKELLKFYKESDIPGRYHVKESMEDEKMNAYLFNSYINDSGKYKYLGRKFSADNIIRWINNIITRIIKPNIYKNPLIPKKTDNESKITVVYNTNK